MITANDISIPAEFRQSEPDVSERYGRTVEAPRGRSQGRRRQARARRPARRGPDRGRRRRAHRHAARERHRLALRARRVGQVRIDWEISVAPETEDASLVQICLQATATDAASRERLFEAWPVIGPIAEAARPADPAQDRGACRGGGRGSLRAPPRRRPGRKRSCASDVETCVETVSLAQLRRYVVSHQGFATRARSSRAADVAATIARIGCVQLDSISTVDRAHRLTLTLAARPLPAEHRVATARRGPDLRVLGPRGLPAADRGLPALQAAHGGARGPPLVGPASGEDREVRGARPRGDPRARRAAVRAPSRARGQTGRDVELEAGEARARAPVRGRRGRRRGTRRLPARCTTCPSA